MDALQTHATHPRSVTNASHQLLVTLSGVIQITESVNLCVLFSGGPPRCDRPGPLEPRVHDQDRAAGTEAANAHQGEHKALAAPGGRHLLKKGCKKK